MTDNITITDETALLVGLWALLAVLALVGAAWLRGRSSGSKQERVNLAPEREALQALAAEVRTGQEELARGEMGIAAQRRAVARRESAADFPAQTAKIEHQRKEIEQRKAEQAKRQAELDEYAADLDLQRVDVANRETALVDERRRLDRDVADHQAALQKLYPPDLQAELVAARDWERLSEALDADGYAALQVERGAAFREQDDLAYAKDGRYDAAQWQAAANAVAELGRTLEECREMARAAHEAVRRKLGTSGGQA